MSEPHVHTWEAIRDADDGSPLFRCACGLYRLVTRTIPQEPDDLLRNHLRLVNRIRSLPPVEA